MKKQQTIALLAALSITLVACSCANRREETIVTGVLDAANGWFQTNALAAKPTCEIMFLNRDPQLDVVGLISTNQQDALVAMLSSQPIQLQCVRFWKEKPALPFHVVMIPEASFEPPEKREVEIKDKLIRTVMLNQ